MGKEVTIDYIDNLINNVIENNPFTTDPSKPLDPFMQKKLEEMLHDADKDLERFLKGKKKPGPKKKKKPAKKKTVKKSKKGNKREKDRNKRARKSNKEISNKIIL